MSYLHANPIPNSPAGGPSKRPRAADVPPEKDDNDANGTLIKLLRKSFEERKDARAKVAAAEADKETVQELFALYQRNPNNETAKQLLYECMEYKNAK